MGKEKYYVALVIRSIDDDKGKVMYYCGCISDKDDAVVDARLLALSQERMNNKNAPPYFYRRAEGETYFEAVGKCIKKVEKACEEEGINPAEIQGMYDLLPGKEDS